jgi:hypothetical protein
MSQHVSTKLWTLSRNPWPLDGAFTPMRACRVHTSVPWFTTSGHERHFPHVHNSWQFPLPQHVHRQQPQHTSPRQNFKWFHHKQCSSRGFRSIPRSASAAKGLLHQNTFEVQPSRAAPSSLIFKRLPIHRIGFFSTGAYRATCSGSSSVQSSCLQPEQPTPSWSTGAYRVCFVCVCFGIFSRHTTSLCYLLILFVFILYSFIEWDSYVICLYYLFSYYIHF